MKTFYTSNYARSGHIPRAVGISYVIPDGYEGSTFGGLAPTLELLSQFKWDTDRITEKEYIERFHTLLIQRGITPQQIYNTFPDGTIFLCYEEPGEFCHRRIVAEWLKDGLGIDVYEWRTEKEQHNSKQNKIVDSLIDF